MIKKIKDFIDNTFGEDIQINAENNRNSVLLASISLMVEIITVDDEEHEDEKKVLRHILKTQFDVADTAIDKIIDDAEHAQKHATDYYHFTSEINAQYSAEEKIELIENLWKIAWADKILEDIEIHVIRKLAKLLHVSHKDFIATKLRVTGQQA